jgi:hypothetical protein
MLTVKPRDNTLEDDESSQIAELMQQNDPELWTIYSGSPAPPVPRF